MALTVTPADLGTYLGDPNIDTARAQLMLDLTIDRCTMYVSPLPDTAKGLVLDVAASAYANPQGVAAETAGPFSVQRPKPGVSLTRAQLRDLRLLAGRGSAFSIDPTPSDAGQGLMPWDQNITWLDGVPLAEDQGPR